MTKDVPLIFDEQQTRMYDDIWLEYGLEEDEIFNSFYDQKSSFNPRYIEAKEAS